MFAVGIGNKELIYPIVFFSCSSLLSAATSFLCPIFGQGLAFNIACVRECDDHVGWRDQVFCAQVKRTMLNMAAAGAQLGLPKLLFDRRQLFANDGGDARGRGQDIQQVFNDRHDFFVFRDDFVLLKAG